MKAAAAVLWCCRYMQTLLLLPILLPSIISPPAVLQRCLNGLRKNVKKVQAALHCIRISKEVKPEKMI